MTSASPMLDVPTELLGLIFCYVEKKDLKSIRLVCKTFRQAALPSLFDEIYLSTNRADLEIAHLTIRHFKTSIKTMILSTVYYQELKWGDFKRLAMYKVKSRDHNLVAHLSLGYNNYCRLRSEQQEGLGSGACLAHFCSALRSLPNARKLIVTDFQPSDFSRDWQLRRGRFWKADGVCSLEDCKLSILEHLDYQVDPISGFSHEHTNPWSLAILALGATGFPLKHFALEPYGSGGVQPCTFQTTFWNPFSLSTIFQNFTQLRLNLWIKPRNLGSLNRRSYIEGHAARVLATAPELESLFIALNLGNVRPDDLGVTNFESILGCCRFRRLKSLILGGFNSTAEELIQFFEGSKDLKQVTIHEHELKAGVWEQVADGMKRSLPNLKDVELNNLMGGLDKKWEATDDGFFNYYGRVEDFFFRDGGNPFTEEAMVAHNCDLGSDDPPPTVNRGGGVGPEERYRMFH